MQRSAAGPWFSFVVSLAALGASGSAATEATAAAAATQSVSVPSAATEGGSEKSVRIVRTSTAPVIDGVLDEPAWSQAAVVDDLHQIRPTEYAPPSERTVVYLMYDDDALYIGARLYDSEPGKITALVLRQGAEIFSDDWFSVVIDPFHDRRSGYRFQTNPNGLRREALFQNVSDQQWDWQGIWYSAAKITSDGWVVEMAIPFKTLSFDPSSDTWGIDFSRSIARRNERMAWVSRNRAVNPSTSGDAVGLVGMRQGAGLDIVPSVSVKTTRDVATGLEDSKLHPSVDVFYKVTPGLTGSLTVNTDFSAVEADNRQVNLSPFALFYPEKRSFFLQDADIFEFGRIDQNGRPFFSRRIGLDVNGAGVDIQAGGKISGRIGRWNVGALSIRQDASEDSPASTATVARVSANVLDESTVGVMLTHGNPQGTADNSLYGMDFLYRNSRLPGGRLLEGEVWTQKTDTVGLEGDDKAYGFGLRSPNNTGIRGGMKFSEFQKNFNPGLGFVNLVGIRDARSAIQYTRRPKAGFVREIEGGIHLQRTEYLTGELQSKQFRVDVLHLQDAPGDNFRLDWSRRTEVLIDPFEIYPGVVIPVGAYSFEERRLEVFPTDQRRLSGGVAFQTGGFYDGRRNQMRGIVQWRPSPHFETHLEYEVNDIVLPEGAFTTRLLSIRADIAFTARLAWSNLIQYDNVSKILGINSRLQWIPKAGQEAFLVLNHALEDYDGDGSFHTTYSDAAVKFSYTFRF